MSRPLSSFYDATKYLGQYVGQNPEMKFLYDTSCMGPDRRRQLAVLETVLSFLPQKDQELDKMFKDFIIPLIRKLGMAEWVRDTVTDMAIRKGFSKESESMGETPVPEETDEPNTESAPT